MARYWCEECRHFPAPESSAWHRELRGYYKCERKRPMLFKMPPDGIPGDMCPDEWGFYSDGCRFYEKGIVENG